MGISTQGNYLITGPLRSGTTLFSKLLWDLPNTVALQEVINPTQFVGKDQQESVAMMQAHFDRIREEILTQKKTINKLMDGRVSDNYASSRGKLKTAWHFLKLRQYDKAYKILRYKRHIGNTVAYVSIDKELTPDFLLYLKAPILYTVYLPVFKNIYPTYAIIRNPLSVLGSWQSLGFFTMDSEYQLYKDLGRNEFAEIMRILNQDDRRIALLHWYFEQYKNHLPSSHIVYYEEMIRSNGKIIESICPNARGVHWQLENKNKNQEYNHRYMKQTAKRLLNSEGAIWSFYSKESVQELLAML